MDGFDLFACPSHRVLFTIWYNDSRRCFLLGGITVEGFVSRTSSSIAMPKSTPKTTPGDTLRLLLLHPRDTNRHFGKQQQQLGVAVRLASNNNSDDIDDVNKGDADALQQSQEANSNDNDNTANQDGVVDIVTSSFDGTGETETPSTLQQDKNAIDPIVAVVAVTAGLVGSFVVLYFELQQARLL